MYLLQMNPANTRSAHTNTHTAVKNKAHKSKYL